MARNEEKAQSMLNRYLAGKQEDQKAPKKRRPYLASECSDLNEADKWRHDILREIGKKVLEIQNSGLGEHRIRDLNDEINKLIREKSHWERRILELGGPDYARTAPKITDSSGRVVADASGRGGGYRYFGAAKTLPGVRELFEKQEAPKIRRTRGELHRHIDGDYYGFRDEDDGILARVEADAEKALREKAIEEFSESERAAGREIGREAGGASNGKKGDNDEVTRFMAYVPLPDVKEIEAKVLETKKAQLLNKYMSEGLLKEQEELKEMLNRK